MAAEKKSSQAASDEAKSAAPQTTEHEPTAGTSDSIETAKPSSGLFLVAVFLVPLILLLIWGYVTR